MFYGYANVPILLSFRAQIEWLVMLPPVFVFTCRWPNTVFSRAFADAIQHVHKDRKNKHAVVTAIIFLCSMPALPLLFFTCSVLMALLFYSKGMLEKVTMQRTQQFSDFSISKEPS